MGIEHKEQEEMKRSTKMDFMLQPAKLYLLLNYNFFFETRRIYIYILEGAC